MLAPFPRPLVDAYSSDLADLEAKLNLRLLKVIFHPVFANVSISEQDSCQREGDQFACFCGDRKPLLHIHSCEVGSDCNAGEHYSI